MFDFANSGYTTVVLTAIFSAYFVKIVAGPEASNGEATLYWTLAMALANLLVLTTAPVIGAIADYSGYKKRFLAMTTIGCIVFTMLLSTVGPGDLLSGFVLIVLATVMFSAGENLIAGFLPEISPPAHMGRVSGYGWALGYVGGVLVLGICLTYITWAEARGDSAQQYVPVTMMITATCFAIAALPTFLLLPERAPRRGLPTPWSFLVVGFREVGKTLHSGRRYTDMARALVAMATYHCGIYTVVVLAAVYAGEVMGFSTSDTIMLILVVNITAAFGALSFGYMQDRFGSVRSIQVVLLLWVAALILIIIKDDRAGFWITANMIGLAMGASQSGGRALIGQFAPATHAAEFFGLWGLATKLSAIIGPMAYGIITAASGGNHQAALMATAGFFVAGLLILGTVNEVRGRQSAITP